MAYVLIKLPRAETVPVMDAEAIAMVEGNCFPQLLERPRRCRMRGHIDVQESAACIFNDHKHVERTKGCRDHDTEVARHHGLGMVAHKGSPALGLHAFAGTPLAMFRPILPHGARRDSQAKLQ